MKKAIKTLDNTLNIVSIDQLTFVHLTFIFRRITLKPMVGLIKDFEIIAVVLKTELTPHKIYREQWFIEFNLCETRKMPIYFVGVASIPNVLIDKNGVVKFDKKIQIGTTSIRRFPIKNISVHDLR